MLGEKSSATVIATDGSRSLGMQPFAPTVLLDVLAQRGETPISHRCSIPMNAAYKPSPATTAIASL